MSHGLGNNHSSLPSLLMRLQYRRVLKQGTKGEGAQLGKNLKKVQFREVALVFVIKAKNQCFLKKF